MVRGPGVGVVLKWRVEQVRPASMQQTLVPAASRPVLHCRLERMLRRLAPQRCERARHLHMP